jgi:predicted metal-dependent hydrolase
MNRESSHHAIDREISCPDGPPLVVHRVVRSRRRTVSLVVNEEAALIVRAPLHMPDRDIASVVREKSAWIHKHQARMRERLTQRPQRLYEEGEGFLWLGRTLRLTPLAEARRVVREDGLLMVPLSGAVERQRLVDHWYRQEARRILTERVRLWAALMGLTVDRVTITAAMKRWGSCSGRANLNFAARLIMAPLEVVDYVVVHELAHIPHKHHGPAFWALVDEQMPDYALHRRWLAEHAHGMVI